MCFTKAPKAPVVTPMYSVDEDYKSVVHETTRADPNMPMDKMADPVTSTPSVSTSAGIKPL